MTGITGDDSLVSQLLDSGDTQEAATVVFSYISMINVPADQVSMVVFFYRHVISSLQPKQDI